MESPQDYGLVITRRGLPFVAEGKITLAGSPLYTSMADSDAVIDDALERFDRVLASVEKKL